MVKYYIVREENGNVVPLSGPFESWAETDEHYDDLIQGEGGSPLWIVRNDHPELLGLPQEHWFEAAFSLPERGTEPPEPRLFASIHCINCHEKIGTKDERRRRALRFPFQEAFEHFLINPRGPVGLFMCERLVYSYHQSLNLCQACQT